MLHDRLDQVDPTLFFWCFPFSLSSLQSGHLESLKREQSVSEVHKQPNILVIL